MILLSYELFKLSFNTIFGSLLDKNINILESLDANSHIFNREETATFFDFDLAKANLIIQGIFTRWHLFLKVIWRRINRFKHVTTENFASPSIFNVPKCLFTVIILMINWLLPHELENSLFTFQDMEHFIIVKFVYGACHIIQFFAR